VSNGKCSVKCEVPLTIHKNSAVASQKTQYFFITKIKFLLPVEIVVHYFGGFTQPINLFYGTSKFCKSKIR
jgi:hypothetical protein